MRLLNSCLFVCLVVASQATALTAAIRGDVPPPPEDLVSEVSEPSTETVIPTTTTSAPPTSTTVSPSIDYEKVQNSNATGLVRDEPKKEPGCDVCEILRKIEDLQLKQESYYFEVMKKFEEMELKRVTDKFEIMTELKKMNSKSDIKLPSPPRPPVTSRPPPSNCEYHRQWPCRPPLCLWWTRCL